MLRDQHESWLLPLVLRRTHERGSTRFGRNLLRRLQKLAGLDAKSFGEANERIESKVHDAPFHPANEANVEEREFFQLVLGKGLTSAEPGHICSDEF